MAVVSSPLKFIGAFDLLVAGFQGHVACCFYPLERLSYCDYCTITITRYVSPEHKD